MSIQDFLEEASKRAARRGRGMSSAEQEVHSLSFNLYHKLNGGDTSRWVKEAAGMLIKSIAPNLSPPDAAEVVLSIEGIALTVLMEFLLSGTLIKREEYKDGTGKQG